MGFTIYCTIYYNDILHTAEGMFACSIWGGRSWEDEALAGRCQQVAKVMLGEPPQDYKTFIQQVGTSRVLQIGGIRLLFFPNIGNNQNPN